MKRAEQANPQGPRAGEWVWSWGRGCVGTGVTLTGMMSLWGGGNNGNVLKLDHGDGCKLGRLTTNLQTLHLEWVNFIVCKSIAHP